MLIAQWILEITDILIKKIVSFLYVSAIPKQFCRARPPPPPHPKTVPTALSL